tara:strand:- start:30401 stop:31510 length:1110 start_codon:yes stop_codon:yes gene_type:complete
MKAYEKVLDQKSTGVNSRREFLQKASVGALALSMPFPAMPDFLKDVPMGVVVHSYAARWNSKTDSKKYPPMTDAIQLMEHCASIGAGGVQTVVRGWTSDFAKKARDRREKLGLYLEGSIGLPKKAEDVADFEKEVIASKEAGVSILRTVCLGTRRYESLHSQSDFDEYTKNSLAWVRLAEPIVRKHKMKLAIENHKDWMAPELVDFIKTIGSEWVGVTVDFGNSIALMEDPMNVVETLAPYAFSTHVKDMGVMEYEKGFLLSEVPLGTGICDLKKMVDVCKKHNPKIRFNLEMITRDPLEIPCLTDEYWNVFEGVSGKYLANTLSMVKEKTSQTPLPTVAGLTAEQRLAFEEENNLACLKYSASNLNIR